MTRSRRQDGHERLQVRSKAKRRFSTPSTRKSLLAIALRVRASATSSKAGNVACVMAPHSRWLQYLKVPFVTDSRIFIAFVELSMFETLSFWKSPILLGNQCPQQTRTSPEGLMSNRLKGSGQV